MRTSPHDLVITGGAQAQTGDFRGNEPVLNRLSLANW